jgi:hypothetical protein
MLLGSIIVSKRIADHPQVVGHNASTFHFDFKK